MLQDTAIFTMAAVVSGIWSIEWHHFQCSWTTSSPYYKVTPIYDAVCLGNITRYKHSFNGILTHTLLNGVILHDKWPWV